MAKLTVVTDDAAREVPFSFGSSLRGVLDAAGIKVRSGCLGNGACGLCRVQVEAGNVKDPTKNERLVLTEEDLNKNMRLACQLTPEDGMRIRIFDFELKSGWRDLTQEYLPSFRPHQFDRAGGAAAGFGLAIDLGTTHISLSLWNLEEGSRLNGRIGPNPQSRYGSDVVTRLTYAGQSPKAAQQIARLPLEAVYQALRDMCDQSKTSPEEIIRVSIVGNTPMMTLLTESDPQIMLDPRSWMQPVDLRPVNLQNLADSLGIDPEATIDVVNPFAGFVGSDLLAGLLACGLTRQTNGLLIDFGTNSEIALWDGKTLRVTSAAGGPAFEGCGIQCGMPAETGAIYRIDRQDSVGLHFHVLGGGDAEGLCGSGLIDLIACLRSTGDLTLTGKFADWIADDGFVVHLNSSAISLTKGDVDMLQRAKAAIGVGIKTLLKMAEMNAEDLSRIFVCGAFGRHLNVHSAQLIGLLPDIPPRQIELCGNTALAGCESLLLSAKAKAELDLLRNQAVIVNLSETSDFETLFMENLYLRPLGADET